MPESKMYENTKTWNPAVGCMFNCVYCRATFQKAVAWSTRQSGKNCPGCLEYYPHEHPERLTRIPGKDIIFAFGNGDISFHRAEYVRQAITALKENLQKSTKHKTVYFQSKNPICFAEYLQDLQPIRDDVVLLTTLETNRDKGYREISEAVLPSKRYKDFLKLDWPRKIVTIEPIVDFDLAIFSEWLEKIAPEAVYLGFNSKPQAVDLPEPSTDKFWQFYSALDAFTDVRLKTVREGRRYNEKN